MKAPAPIPCEALAYVFLAVLAMLVIHHDSRPLTDPRSPDLQFADAVR